MPTWHSPESSGEIAQIGLACGLVYEEPSELMIGMSGPSPLWAEGPALHKKAT